MATTIIWLLLGLAYAWNVEKLARMSRSPDPWATAVPSPASAHASVAIAVAAEDGALSRAHGGIAR